MAKSVFFLLFAASLFLTVIAYAEPPLPGPYPATVIAVTDGDTVKVKVRIWLGLDKEVAVRIKGVDTPEITHSRCIEEKELGRKAKRYLESVLPKESMVQLTNIQRDKYGGRVVASLQASDHQNIGQLLINTGLATRYDGKEKKKSWCSPET